jgi:sugar lactone lactonase YvrE
MAYGSEPQKALAADLVLAGDKPAICITEPEAGSAATEMRTTARRQGDAYVLDGSKTWITGGGISKLHLIFARVHDAAGRDQGIGGFIAVKVFRIDARSGAMTVIAGTGEPGFSGDGGPATQAQVRNPEWLVLDPQGNLILGDRGNCRVRRIDARTGVITTIAGTGRMGFSGDGGPATQADMTHPFGLAYDGQGNLFVFDTEVHRIRRIDAATGVITTVVGNGQPPTTESSRPTAT